MLKFLRNKLFLIVITYLLFLGVPLFSYGASLDTKTMDRIQVVTQQINLFKERLNQGEHELAELQQEHDKKISQLAIEKTSKNLLNKASLDILVSKSNLESIDIELTDSQQTVNWLEKNIQEIDNQLNVLNIFGLKIANDEMINIQELKYDSDYQKELLKLEKIKVKYLQQLEKIANNILQLRKDSYNRINALLKSRNLLLIKQQQMKDELSFQEQQNYWLKQLNSFYDRLAKVDPNKSNEAYSALKRNIFYANENANFSYFQSLMARYKDQIQQMKSTVLKSNSISLLNEVGDQVQILSKQIGRLDAILKTRVNVLEQHLSSFSNRKSKNESIRIYLDRLTSLKDQYQSANETLINLNKSLIAFRVILDQELQKELSARQGFPNFGFKTMLDLGKEMLLVPALAFQVMKNLSLQLMKVFHTSKTFGFGLFILLQGAALFASFFLYKMLSYFAKRTSCEGEEINSRWLGVQWFKRNFIDLALIGNVLGAMFFIGIPFNSFAFLVYLSLVWLIFKSILTLARLCLLETTHHSAGHDVKLYLRLKWIMFLGGSIIALTVFIHQLPLIYELKALCDQLFLMFLFVVSLLLLRSWDVLPSLLLSQMEINHLYLRNSIRFLGLLVPFLLLVNSVVGLLGYMNLVMTIAWYEGLFLFVLVTYLMVRGLLSSGIEQLSQLMIRYVHNGWLWTEAFLKPMDKLLRITLFLMAWGLLFVLYGWDQQSPIVERLTGLLHYRLASILNTSITPLSVIELFIVISIFYWTAKWTREFVYRILSSRTRDMGIRNSIAILSQYSVILLGAFIGLRVLGIDLRALAVVFGMFAFGIGLGLRDLANNFACGFLILFERRWVFGVMFNLKKMKVKVRIFGSGPIPVKKGTIRN